jgi:hypothetical protein
MKNWGISTGLLPMLTAPCAVLATILIALILASPAVADTAICSPGTGPGQCTNPQGVAVNNETEKLYVVDAGNNQVDVFSSAGAFLTSFGSSGSGAGQFKAPGDIVVDNDLASPSHGAVYVFDAGNNRVVKFDADGKFLLAFGGGVNLTTGEDICVAGSGDVCGPGSQGSGTGEFDSAVGSVPALGIGPSGMVYVGDATKTAEIGEEVRDRVQRFTPSGTFESELVLFKESPRRLSKLVVESSGSFYVSFERGVGINKYGPTGELISAIPEGDTAALAIDTKNHLFVANQNEGRNIVEYDSSGSPIRRFGYGFLPVATNGIAPFKGASGDISVADSTGVRQLSFPSPGPLVLPQPCVTNPIGNTSATVTCQANPEGKPTTIHFDYIDDAGFKSGEFANPETQHSAESDSIGEDFQLHAAGSKLAPLKPETVYHYRVVASNADAPAGVIGPEGTFETKPAIEFGPSYASNVGIDSAQLNANVNPLGIPTTGYFEYVGDAQFQQSGFATAAKAPAEGTIDFGAGEAMKTGSAVVASLEPGTTYHFRLVAQNLVTKTGPEETFTTFTANPLALPDGRTYEQVSPPQKGSGEVGAPNAASGLVDGTHMRIVQSSRSGDAITYTSFTAFVDPESSPGASQYLSRRGGGRWLTRNITPPTRGSNPLQPPYLGFLEDLKFGAVSVKEPALAAGAPPNLPNLYLRDTETSAYQLLTPAPPLPLPPPGEYCVGYAGASADGSRIIFLAQGALTEGGPLSPGFSLYEWSAEGGVRLVSVLPDGTPAPPSPSPGKPNSAFGKDDGACGVGVKRLRHVISDDGSKIFWTYVPTAKTAETRLYARLNGSETVQLDLKQGGVGPAGGGQFQAASADGTKVFFTNDNPLVPGAAAGDLYRYDFEAPVGQRLSDISKDPTPGSDPPSVRGIVGASETGEYVYFVANGALATGASPGNCQGETGVCNLYLWRDGEGTRFIATLDSIDSRAWRPVPAQQNARVSPDGTHLAFVSVASPTGYDNTLARSGGCAPDNEGVLEGSSACAEVYLYDAAADDLLCASCNPSGSRPAGPSFLPAWGSPYQQPRHLSDDGQRLFFETLDSLSPNDVNGNRDVYELEAEGAGGCSAQSPTYQPASHSCLYLISTGSSEDESYLLDASADGSDVFISTRQRLVGWDQDERYDVYDARVGPGFPEPVAPRPPCAGEACKAPPLPTPATAAAGTPDFIGPGNRIEKPRRHRKAHKQRKPHKKTTHAKHKGRNSR